MSEKTNKKQMSNKNEHHAEEYKLQHTNVLNLSGSVREVCTRFDYLSRMTKDKRNILDKPGVDWLLSDVQLDDSEITSLSLYLHGQLKNHKISMKPAEIAQRINIHLNFDNIWKNRNYVGEQDGQLFVQVGKHAVYIANVLLEPVYTITVHNGEKYHIYNVQVKGDPKTYQIRLTASDFNSIKSIQEQFKLQLGYTSAYINNCGPYMIDLAYKLIDLAVWEHNKQGTSLIGLERLEAHGPKYFCTPDAIYGADGSISNDIVYMGNEQANKEEVSKLSNLKYDKKKWPKTAKQLLKSIMKLNSKEAMLAIVGWMGSIPHDYAIRKEAGTNFFPHCQIVAEPGAGKSTLVQLLKQFMGHSDAAPRVFPSPAETQKLLNSSYTIPAILDEYGKRWTEDRARAIDGILVESFTKAGYSKGKSDQSSIYYKYKNPLLLMGQIGPKDGALATRIVPVYLYKSFHKSKKGKEAFKLLNELNKMEDKNFWVGYNLWCAKHTNYEVESQYDQYRTFARSATDDSRVADIQAVVMLGLHYIHKLALELGVSEAELGYDSDDIFSVPSTLNEVASATETDDVSPLTDFLRAVASFGITHGNSSAYGINFGKGYNVMYYKPTNDGAGKYGRPGKEHEACVFGQETVAIKVGEMVDALNRLSRKDKFDMHEIMTFIESSFRESLENGGKGLAVAPKLYRLKINKSSSYYTLFSRETLSELVPDFDRMSNMD